MIVLDIGLPGIDGVFYCERLRESLRTRRLPIIAISGSEEAGRRARLAGANAVLIKPLEPLHLLATVEQALRRLEPHDSTDRDRRTADICG